MKDKKNSLKAKGAFSCTSCQFSSMCRKKLHVHEGKVHKKVINILECCGIHFRNKANLLKHMGECHPFRYKCNICGRGFYYLASVVRHKNTHSGKKKHECSFCDYASFQRCNLDRHLKRHNNKGENCNQPDTDSFKMRKGVLLKCTLCSYQTKQKTVLSKHLATMHKKMASDLKHRDSHFPSKTAPRQIIATCDSLNCRNKTASCEQVLGSQQFLQHQKNACEDTIPSADDSTQQPLEENVSDSDCTFTKGKAVETHSILRSCSRCRPTVSSRKEIALSTNKEQENRKHNFRVEEKSNDSGGKVTYETISQQHKPISHLKGPSGLLQFTPHKLQKHASTHSEFKKYTCNLCDHVSSWKDHIKHMMEHIRRKNHNLSHTHWSPPLKNDSVVIDSVPISPNGVMFNSIIHDEARHLRTQIPTTMFVSKLLPLLKRLLEICTSIVNLIRGAMDMEVRFRAIESFEFVWNISKIAIVRWEDLIGPTDGNSSFNAARYAYTMLPVFLDLEKDEHLEMTEHIIILILNIVRVNL